MMKKKIKWVLMVLFLFLAYPAVFAKATELNDTEISESPTFAQPQKDAKKDVLTEKISLDYKDADISSILHSLSYTYGLNLVTSSEVKGKITLSLRDVTLAHALDAILSANGCNYSRKADIIYISPGSADGAQLVTEPLSLKYLKAADAQNFLRKVLSPKGDIKVDEIANIFIVTDYQGNLDKFKGLLEIVDQPPQQVLIEAKIVDITSKDLQNLGVTWQVDYNPGTGLFSRHGIATQERLKATGTIAGPSSSLSGGQFKLDSLTLKGLSATATLDALVQDQKAHLLASPSIVVLNNREARIIIGEKVPYKERTQTTTGTTETTKFIDVGTTLRVTPSINADGYITLNVHPEVSSVSALLDAGPRITTREADTMVRVKEGETIVIGGLIKQEDNRTRSRVPILGYIPIVGYLFGNRSKDQTQVELAVFITPKILRSREEMQAANKSVFEEEAVVNIMATGSLNTQMKLMEKANHLAKSSGLESHHKEDWLRKRQALNLYESILTQFPDGPKAAEAGYEAANIYYDLGQLYLSRDLCQQIASDYSDSAFAPRAMALYEIINVSLKKEAQEKLLSEQREKERLAREEQREVRLQREDQERQEKQAELQRQKEEQGRLRAEQKKQRQQRQSELQAEREKQELVAKRQKELAEKQAQIQARQQELTQAARKKAEEQTSLQVLCKQAAAARREKAAQLKEEKRKQAEKAARLREIERKKAREEAQRKKEEAQRKKTVGL